MAEGKNPLTGMDFPDPDVIRVGDTYYMISTTMHFFPGGQILRSYDLIHWEPCSCLYDRLESTPGEMLEGEQTIYGHGMWAASLRYNKGRFYAVFIAHEWEQTFLFTAEKAEGPWKKSYIEGIYHDCSLFFDDDGRNYLVYGNRNIRLTELKEDLSGPKPGGTDRIIIRDAPGNFLGYEGSHLYKINGRYVLFLIHSRQQRWFRTQACFISDRVDGVWAGGDALESDLQGYGSGVAQGGIVDTPEGKWYAIMFQDRGAIGRIPVLVPMTWNQSGYPVFGKAETDISTDSTRPDYEYAPLYGNDDFSGSGMKKYWQFNHEPREGFWRLGDGKYIIQTDKLSRTVEFARNTLTQRTVSPRCAAEVTVDAESLNPGDTAGLCLLMGTYGLIGIARTDQGLVLKMTAREEGKGREKEYTSIPVSESKVRLRAEANFENRMDEVQFFFLKGSEWDKLGPTHHLRFTLDHFTGARFGLFMYSTKITGGEAVFRDFRYVV